MSNFDFKIKSSPFSWDENFSEVALEDFSMIQKELPYCTCQSIGMALAKLELLENKDAKWRVKMNKVNAKDIRETLNVMGNVFEEKNKKYGNSFEISVNKYGIIAALTRISDKFNRIENLILTNDNGTSDESIMDTLIDMANYCVMTAVYMQNSEEKNNATN